MAETTARRKPRCTGTYPNADGPGTYRCGKKPRHKDEEHGPGEYSDPAEQPTLSLAEKLEATKPAGPDGEATFRARRPSRYSATQLERATGCLHAHYLGRIGDVGGDRLDRGKVVHEVTAAVSHHAYAEQLERVEPETAREVAQATLAKPLTERMTMPREFYDDAIRHAGNYAAAMEFWPDAELFLVEHLVTQDLGGRTFSGRIDLLQTRGNTLKIDDVKSSPFIPPAEVVRKAIQNPLYARLMWQSLPHIELFDLAQVYTEEEDPTRARITTSEDGSPVPLEEILAADAYLDAIGLQLDDAWTVYGELGDHAAASIFPALGGEHCRRCPAKHLCPIPKELNPEVLVDTEADAGNLLARLVAVDGWRGAVNLALQSWVERQDGQPIVAGGMQALYADVDGGWQVKKGQTLSVKETLEDKDPDKVGELLQERKPGRRWTIKKED